MKHKFKVGDILGYDQNKSEYYNPTDTENEFRFTEWKFEVVKLEHPIFPDSYGLKYVGNPSIMPVFCNTNGELYALKETELFSFYN